MRARCAVCAGGVRRQMEGRDRPDGQQTGETCAIHSPLSSRSLTGVRAARPSSDEQARVHDPAMAQVTHVRASVARGHGAGAGATAVLRSYDLSNAFYHPCIPKARR